MEFKWLQLLHVCENVRECMCSKYICLFAVLNDCIGIFKFAFVDKNPCVSCVYIIHISEGRRGQVTCVTLRKQVWYITWYFVLVIFN